MFLLVKFGIQPRFVFPVTSPDIPGRGKRARPPLKVRQGGSLTKGLIRQDRVICTLMDGPEDKQALGQSGI